MPCVEHDLGPDVVGVERRHGPAERVVEQHRTDAGRVRQLEAVSRREERLVLPDRQPLVVERRPAGAGPPRSDDRPAGDQRTRLCLLLALDLASEPIRERHADLHPGPVAVGDNGGVGLARERAHRDRLRERARERAAVGEQIVDEPGRRRAEELMRMRARIGEDGEDCRLVEVGHEAVERVACLLVALAHDGGAHHLAGRIERHLRAVAVGVGELARLQGAVVVLGGRDIAQRVTGRCDEEIVRVERDNTLGPEPGTMKRIAGAMGQEKMGAGVGALRGWLVCRVRRKKDATRRHPPPRIAGGVHVAPFGLEHRRRDPIAEAECQELRRECQPVGLASQRQRLDPSGREERQHVAPARSHVVRPVQRAGVIGQTLLEPASVRGRLERNRRCRRHGAEHLGEVEAAAPGPEREAGQLVGAGVTRRGRPIRVRVVDGIGEPALGAGRVQRSLSGPIFRRKRQVGGPASVADRGGFQRRCRRHPSRA